LQSRVLQFAGIGEIRPDEGELLVRLPVNGTVLLEERYDLATGLIDEEKSRVVFTDLRGSTLATASYKPGDKTPPVVQSEAVYDPWGRLLERDGTAPDPLHAFAGHEPDPGTGLYQFGARVYDPTLRRWLSPDFTFLTLPERDAAWARQINLYAYVSSSPIRYLDRTGKVMEGADRYSAERLARVIEETTNRQATVHNDNTVTVDRGVVVDPGRAGSATALELFEELDMDLDTMTTFKFHPSENPEGDNPGESYRQRVTVWERTAEKVPGGVNKVTIHEAVSSSDKAALEAERRRKSGDNANPDPNVEIADKVSEELGEPKRDLNKEPHYPHDQRFTVPASNIPLPAGAIPLDDFDGFV
jgi:RHS repeat-associated protein